MSTIRTVHNVLSIDGCGFRGLTQLLILDELMKQHSGKPDSPSLPHEVFDLICGTATGGLIAILLGRLQMSCKQAIDAYRDAEGAIFGEAWTIGSILAQANSFDPTRFRARLEEIIKNSVGNSNAPMLATNQRCRTFVTVVSTSTAVDADADRIRSYPSPPRRSGPTDPSTTPEHPWSIRDAALGTSSCPRLFSPFDLGEFGSFMGANTSGFSNPSMIAYLEAQDIWGQDAEITLISLGMGLRQQHDYQTLTEQKIEGMIKNLGVVPATSEAEQLRKLISHTQLVATSTQVKHLRLQVLIDRNLKQKYMRLDPYRDPRRDHLTFVDYVQQPNVQGIVNDFIQGHLKRFDRAVDFVQGVRSKWIEIQGYTCDAGRLVPWDRPKGVTELSLGRIMRECLLLEARDRTCYPISCFAVERNRSSERVNGVEMMTGNIHLFPDDDKTLFVRVLLDDQWRFFPQCRGGWEDESTEEPSAAKDPIDAIQYARTLPNFQQIKAFRSDGQYTTADVNREEVNIYETSFDLPYYGTWVRTGTA